MRIVKPPLFTVDKGLTIFLAGTIEMGQSVDWQKIAEELIREKSSKAGIETTVFNPRRDDWDSSLEQKKDSPKFRQQVLWELQHLEKAKKILFYFEPGTNSMISLMELGAFGMDAPSDVVVVCPSGYCRKGNVDIFCELYGIDQFETIAEAIDSIYH